MTFERITINSAQMDGVPCIRELRIPTVVDADFPDLEQEDVAEALRYDPILGSPSPCFIMILLVT